jgi:hypothetical protein
MSPITNHHQTNITKLSEGGIEFYKPGSGETETPQYIVSNHKKEEHKKGESNVKGRVNGDPVFLCVYSPVPAGLLNGNRQNKCR